MKFVLCIVCLLGCEPILVGQDVAADTHRNQEVTFLRTIQGNWKIRRVYRNGAIQNQRVNATGVRIGADRLEFTGLAQNSSDIHWTYEKIHPNAKRIDLLIQYPANMVNGKPNRYVLILDGDLMWLLANLSDTTKHTTSLKPNKDNFCMVLTRFSQQKKAELTDEREPE